MRVLHLISSSGFYGAENVLLNLAKSLKEDGCEPCVVCIKGASRPDPEIYLRAEREGIKSKIVYGRRRLDFKIIRQIQNIVKEEGVDLIHSHGYKSNFYGLTAARRSGVPIISTIHLWTGETMKLRFYEYLDRRWMVRKMDHVVLVSPTFRDDVKKSNLASARISYIPNGIDTETFNPSNIHSDLRGELGLNNSLVIGNVARLNQEKGHHHLIEAFEKAQSEIPNARLLIIGDGPLEDDLRAEVNSRALTGKVIFTGKRKDMPSLYKAMDIFAMSSLKEGMPMALLEAMSMELPVITTDVGAVPYIISNNENGIMIKAENPGILAEKIVSLLKDASMRKRLGWEARRTVLSNFSSASLYRRYFEIYVNVLEANDGKN